MSPLPPDDVRPLLTGWAQGDAGAIEALVAWSTPRLRAVLPRHGEVEIAAALRRALHAAPPFSVTGDDRLAALLARLVEHQLEDHEAPRRPASPGATSSLLDLDRGRDAGAGDPGRQNARLKLALLLLPAKDRKLLLLLWAGLDDAAVAARLGEDPELVARGRARAEQAHRLVAQHLELGAIEAALDAAGAPRRASDPWGSATHWSMVLGAVASDDSQRVRESWRRLVQRYEGPIRGAIRRALGNARDSDDLAAEFFSYLYEHDVLAKAQPRGGKFRAYIQAVLRNFLHRHRRRTRTGIGLEQVAPPVANPADHALEQADELEWATHVLHLALGRLLEERPRDGDILVRYYGIARPGAEVTPRAHDRDDIAASLGMTLAAVDQATHRARRRLRDLIERELRETVDGAEAMSAEVEWIGRRLLQAYPGLM